MDNRFAYSDITDKCYGLTGMVLSLNIWDKSSILDYISIEEGDDSISFSPEFCFNGNPRLSAKIAWNELLEQYQLLTGMVIGNILCRYYVHHNRQLTPEGVTALHDFLADEGREQCSLEDDEIDAIFRKTFDYLSKVYKNYQIKDIASKFAAMLSRRHKMSATEITDELHLLRLI